MFLSLVQVGWILEKSPLQVKAPVPQDGLGETAERLRIAWAERCPRLAQVAQSSPWQLKSEMVIEIDFGLVLGLAVPSTSLDDLLCCNPLTKAQIVINFCIIGLRRSLARSLPGLCVLQQDMVPGTSCCCCWSQVLNVSSEGSVTICSWHCKVSSGRCSAGTCWDLLHLVHVFS